MQQQEKNERDGANIYSRRTNLELSETSPDSPEPGRKKKGHLFSRLIFARLVFAIHQSRQSGTSPETSPECHGKRAIFEQGKNNIFRVFDT